MFNDWQSTESLHLLEAAIRHLCIQNASAKKGYVHFSEYFIKYGFAVRKDEALVQSYIWANSHDCAFRVPKVLHYFEDSHSELSCGLRCGYLVMEFVDSNGGSVTLDGIRQALLDIWKIPIPNPFKVGPLGQGPVCGYLWADYDIPHRFESVTELNTFINKCLNLRRSKIQSDAIEFETARLVICHGDLSERNLRMATNGHLYILDWALAGVYPEVFEHFALDYLSESKGERLANELRVLPELSKRVKSEDIEKLYEVYRAFLTCDII